MNRPVSILTPQQTALQGLALRQLESLSETLRRLQAVTTDRSDVETVQDATENVTNSQTLLRDWFGTEPSEE